MNVMSNQHYRQTHRLWMVVVLLGALVVGLFQPSSVAQANNSYAYYWSLTFDFEESANGNLYVAVGHNENGGVQEPPIYAQTVKVPCTRVGNASVSGGALLLNGGHLRCDLDVQRAVQAAFAACGLIVKGCHLNVPAEDVYASFRAEATVRSATPGNAPIFYHPDAAYTINPQSSSTQITAALTPHGVIPSTPLPAFPILGTWQDYTAIHSCGAACNMYYETAGGLQVVNTANAKVEFYTSASTIYIGYDPIINQAAPAGTEIGYLFVDPPNHGND